MAFYQRVARTFDVVTDAQAVRDNGRIGRYDFAQTLDSANRLMPYGCYVLQFNNLTDDVDDALWNAIELSVEIVYRCRFGGSYVKPFDANYNFELQQDDAHAGGTSLQQNSPNFLFNRQVDLAQEPDGTGNDDPNYPPLSYRSWATAQTGTNFSVQDDWLHMY